MAVLYFKILDVIFPIIDGTFYWGEGNYRGNSDNSFYSPSSSDLHNSECDETLSVRSTALALMVYTERGEYMTEPIVRWLNSRRRSGWDSTIDTSMYQYKFYKMDIRRLIEYDTIITA